MPLSEKAKILLAILKESAEHNVAISNELIEIMARHMDISDAEVTEITLSFLATAQEILKQHSPI